MKALYQIILEGGASGHMSHPYDYTEFTLRELKGLIRNLFTGKITDITEKIDGTNIQATMNPQGEVVFVRNKGDLNSARGGMSISDMAAKWADKPKVAETFVSAGETITKVFQQIGKQFFNPSADTKILANCECVVAGKTNIMPYGSAQVDFHDLWVYKKEGETWEKVEVTKKGLDKIQKACESVDGAQLTPQVVVKIVDDSKKMAVDFIKMLDKLWKAEGLGEQDTIETWKKKRFNAYCHDNDYDWICGSVEGMDILYNRWFNSDKSVNLRVLKQNYYPNHGDDLGVMDKSGYKFLASKVMDPLDTFFGQLGNKIISLCQGMINDGSENAVIQQLKDEVEDVTRYVRSAGSIEANEKLTKQLNRLEALGNELNSSEGIVFRYKDKLMKCTGSFAALNQLTNIKYMDMTK